MLFGVHDDFVKDILKCGYTEKQAPETEKLSRNQENDEHGKEMDLHDGAHDLRIQNIGFNQMNSDNEQNQFQNEKKTACLKPQDTDGQTRKKEAHNRYETTDKDDQRKKNG